MKLKINVILFLSFVLVIFFFLTFQVIQAQIPPFFEAKKIKRINTPSQSNLIQSYFLDNQIGWIISKKEILKTKNGGKKWQLINPKLSFSENLAKIHFHDSKAGIVLVQKKPINWDDSQNYFKVLQTNDGGLNWKEKKLGLDGVVIDLVFTDKRNGWIIGYKKKGNLLIGYKYLIFQTRDGGNSWEDISLKIENIVIGNVKPINYSMQNYVIFSLVKMQESIKLLLNNNIILTSLDNGETWSKTEIDNKEENYGIFCCSGVNDEGRLWFSKTANSYEGIFGEIGINNKDSEVIWRRIGKIYFEKVEYFSNNKFVVVGSYFAKNMKKEGVILITPDNGKTWQTIYHSKKISSFNSISKLTKHNLIVTGAKGSVVTITLNNN